MVMDLMSQIPVVRYFCIVRCWVAVMGLCVMDIGVNECLSNDTCPGSQQCLDLPTHHICVCPHGFQITETGCEGWSTHYMLFLCPLTKIHWFCWQISMSVNNMATVVSIVPTPKAAFLAVVLMDTHSSQTT